MRNISSKDIHVVQALTNSLYYYMFKHCINNQLLELHLFIVGFSMVHACDIHVT